jgi:hypothetical protein
LPQLHDEASGNELLKLCCISGILAGSMNSNLIRERLNRNTRAFVFRLSDGSRVTVAHPDFAAVAPGKIIVIHPKTQAVEEIDPLHVVAIEESSKSSKSNGKH